MSPEFAPQASHPWIKTYTWDLFNFQLILLSACLPMDTELSLGFRTPAAVLIPLLHNCPPEAINSHIAFMPGTIPRADLYPQKLSQANFYFFFHCHGPISDLYSLLYCILSFFIYTSFDSLYTCWINFSRRYLSFAQKPCVLYFPFAPPNLFHSFLCAVLCPGKKAYMDSINGLLCLLAYN